ncbi:hypothetical protein AKJ09_08323 [Labilithrix luteola]|uniref:Uncharacterized protein n=1 Tax=Labilithrix luteola TaxID=1391654 RepID=A0A0K1Q8D0_9BACT|nr:hypothetical protein [Labilithrix luteola]AKV01660.1 hypothetical protein AKJ09_08323 [Labilithrix luteola]
MGRHRLEFGPDVLAQIGALVAAGKSAAAITAELAASGVVASRATIDRRVRELRDGRRVVSKREIGRACCVACRRLLPKEKT